tara:strand:- start:29 stop:421 length:393 start_codon:yes stop_codon:yes gene_type:complete
MKKESTFNTWLRKKFYEKSHGKIVVERIENSIGTGVPDLFIILPNKTLFIESKFETSTLRPTQYAFQIKANGIIKDNTFECMSVSCYPKTNRFVVNKYDLSSITDDGFEPISSVDYSLDDTGFSQFFNNL